MRIRYATVESVSENKILAKFDGESSTSNKYYVYPKGYTPIVGDRAGFIVDENKKYICIGIY